MAPTRRRRRSRRLRSGSSRRSCCRSRKTTMHICDIFAAHRTTFSFEFSPPKLDEDWEQLYQTIGELEALHPSFVSVTYGAGGSTRQRTHDLVVRLKESSTCDPIPHLTCVCHSEE